MIHPSVSHGERGQALVESSLTVVAYLAVFLGLVEIGQFLYVHQALVERARTAVRWGAVNAWDNANSPTEITNMVLYGSTTIPPGVQPAFGLAASNVTVSRPQPDYSAADRIVITVSGYALTFLTNSVVVGYFGGQSNPSNQIAGLTIQASCPYEVTNGSSH